MSTGSDTVLSLKLSPLMGGLRYLLWEGLGEPDWERGR